jgi:uncharacterized membrane protein
MIPSAAVNAGGSPAAVVFMVVAAGLLAAAILAGVWARRADQVLGVTLGLILLGLCVAMSYEAAATWVHAPWLKTISQISNEAFNNYRALWGAVYFVLILLAGLFTMHFTLEVRRQQSADWGLLGSGILILLNGALFSFWFNWLP